MTENETRRFIPMLPLAYVREMFAAMVCISSLAAATILRGGRSL
jgi:hypothetical protein